MPLKLCGKCQVVKPKTDFNRAARETDGRQHWCRECFRTYFKARGKVHLEQVARSQGKRRGERIALVQEHLRAHPCTDCGESDIGVLEFDHIATGVKEDDVSWLVFQCWPIELIEAEIRRCEVVCANCHRRRTARRAGWHRLNPDATPRSAERHPRRWRNMRWLYEHLAGHPCVDCGEADPVVLEFDHVGNKRGKVTTLAWGEYSIRTLQHEVDQCEVRCANCHRRVTAARRGSHRTNGK